MIQFMQAAGGSNASFLIMMVIIFAIMWLFMIRPQQKKQKEIQKFRNSIVVGSQVVTAGGIYGTVVAIDETNNILSLEIAKNVHIRIDRNSVFQSAQPQENK
ncbi:MAG: preprotein translocase subunit YajC [Bacteroidaceae bacterium]|nr:preprotein translocase subunit YajC [Bacteroidaceae bacterium]MBR6846489.1 preprotein translocase subunit YajC [Bacteroidaceae bacterium]MCR5334484.1 preprotein translocase subunit YajC [Bacteroidaceae bacterium]